MDTNQRRHSIGSTFVEPAGRGPLLPTTHRACGQRHEPFTSCPLTPEQADGLACVGCGRSGGAMRPVGEVEGVQVFAHQVCHPTG